MKLTPNQIQTLRVSGVLSPYNNQKKNLRLEWKKLEAAFTKDRSITSETLIDHIEFFRKCVINFVKKSAACIRKNRNSVLTARIMHLCVLHELWSLVEVSLPFPLLASFHQPNEASTGFIEKLENGDVKKTLEA